jgi:hypothetical protein
MFKYETSDIRCGGVHWNKGLAREWNGLDGLPIRIEMDDERCRTDKVRDQGRLEIHGTYDNPRTNPVPVVRNLWRNHCNSSVSPLLVHRVRFGNIASPGGQIPTHQKTNHRSRLASLGHPQDSCAGVVRYSSEAHRLSRCWQCSIHDMIESCSHWLICCNDSIMCLEVIVEECLKMDQM